MAAATALTACGTTNTPPPPPPIVQLPPEVIEPAIETPVEETSVKLTGLVPPHMADRDLARVALLLPFSSTNTSARSESLRLLRAAELALFERGGSNLLMIPKDTQGTPDGARAAAESAIADGADIIIGPLFSHSVSTAGQVAREANIPVIAFSTDLSISGDGVYLLSFPPEIEVARIVEYSSRQGVERFAYLGAQNRYGMAVYNALRDQAHMNSGALSAEAFYTGDVEAMSRAAARLAEGVFEEVSADDARKLRRTDWVPAPEAPFQAVLLPEGGVRLRALGPLLVSQAVDPLIVRFIGTGLWNDEALLREPALYGGWFAGPDITVRDRFERSYETAFGDEPSRLASLAYDAMALAAHLDGGDAGFTRDALENPEGFFGADGLFRFHQNGRIERGLAIYEVRSRGFREIEPAPVSFDPAKIEPQEVSALLGTDITDQLAR